LLDLLYGLKYFKERIHKNFHNLVPPPPPPTLQENIVLPSIYNVTGNQKIEYL
jgi:hypothetical protein